MRQLLLFVRARLKFALRQELRAETCREFSSFEFVLRLRITSLKPQTIRFHMLKKSEEATRKRCASSRKKNSILGRQNRRATIKTCLKSPPHGLRSTIPTAGRLEHNE